MTDHDDEIEEMRRDAERWRKLCYLLAAAPYGGGVVEENLSLYATVQSSFKHYRNMRAELYWTETSDEPLNLGSALDAVEIDHV